MRGISLRLGPALVVAVLVAAGCGDDDDTNTTASTTAAPETTVVATTTSVADDVQLLIVLNPDGLGFTTADSGSVSRIDFGSDQQLTRDAVVKSLGEPVEEGEEPECPPGPAEQARFDEIMLTFQGGTFVGWSVGNGSTLTTADGIGVGSTLAELRAAFADVDFVESTLGVEVTAGEYDVLVSEDTDAGTVDAMLAGVNCVFR